MKNKITWLTALLCLVACVGLSVGVAYGRYRTQTAPQDLILESRALEAVQFGGSISDNALSPMPTQWESGEDGAHTLSFLIANGQKTNKASETSIDVGLRVTASVGIGAPENVKLALTVGETRYLGVAEEIPENGRLYDAFGAGWVYRFYREKDSEGEITYDERDEFQCTLVGGQLSTVNVSLEMKGEADFISLLELRATATPHIQ